MRVFTLIFFVSVLETLSALSAKNDWRGKSVDFSHGNLQVSPNKHYLQHADGTPFLYLADTGWEMLSRLNEAEVELYLENRRAKGFTVIQTVIMDELDGRTVDSTYLDWIKKVLNIAKEKGIYLALVPTWGDKVDKKWGKGPEIFTPETAKAYGNLLGRRFKDIPNIIWINGGDRDGEGKNFGVWNALAMGIKEYDPNHLMTFHPQGEHSSSFWFHDAIWLDFNMFQSGHAQSDYGIYKRLLLPDLKKQPTKPVLDGEPRYENIVENFKKGNRRFTDYDIRQTLYQSMLSGTCGYTYGCNDVWQMFEQSRESVIFADTPWKKAIDFSGADQLIHFRRITKFVDFFQGKPRPELIKQDDLKDEDYPVAFGGKDFAIFYLPHGNPLKIELTFSDKKNKNLYWINPVTGKITKDKQKIRGNETVLVPFAKRENNDWIAIIK